MRISNNELTIDIAPLGAELQSITGADGSQWLWHGDPQWWSGRAPLLFPVVGKSPDGTVTIEGKSYRMQPHGFVRRSTFDVASEHADRATLMLRASAETRESFPFDFVFSVTYALSGNSLLTSIEVANLDTRDMPFGFGFHPAFSWPLPGAVAGQRHFLKLSNDGEPNFLQLNNDGLILPEAHQSPFTKGEMTLAHEQFSNDALLFPFGIGNSMTFAAERGASVGLSWSNLPNFGIWQKPGAPYLCRRSSGSALAARAGAA
jgi:galactose mutarotase-like enzyme